MTAAENAQILDATLAALLSATEAAQRGQLLYDAYMQAGAVRAALEAGEPAVWWPGFPLAAAYMVQRYAR